MKRGKWFLKCLLAGALLLLVLGLVTMLLWNWLVPAIFNGPQLQFFEAVGLLVLAKILFSGWGGRRFGNGGLHSWRQSYYEKLSSMSPEDRERFKSRMREKWRCDKPAGGNAGPSKD